MELSKRLRAILSLVGKCEVLSDIGTDHAYIPIEAIRADLCKRAIACDITQGPLGIAAKNISDAGLSDVIETRLGNGLAPLHEDEADCIIIAGMGGMNILQILTAGLEKIKKSRLILQPQHDIEKLRRFLYNNGFEITREEVVHKEGRFYEIIRAEYTGKTEMPSAGELFLGKAKNPAAYDYFIYLRNKIRKYIDNITNDEDKTRAERELRWLEEITK